MQASQFFIKMQEYIASGSFRCLVSLWNSMSYENRLRNKIFQKHVNILFAPGFWGISLHDCC